MAQPRVSCLQQVNDRSYIMGITRRANRERPLSTQAGRSAGPSERLKPDPQRPLVCIAMTTAGHAPQETSSDTQSFQCPGRPEGRVPRISPVAWQDRRRVRRERVAVVAWKSIVDRALRPAKVEGAGERDSGDADPRASRGRIFAPRRRTKRGANRCCQLRLATVTVARCSGAGKWWRQHRRGMRGRRCRSSPPRRRAAKSRRIGRA